jgi:hypothetical protein
MRRHHAGTQFANDVFPGLGIASDAAKVKRLQRQASGQIDIVVAVETKLLDCCVMRRCQFFPGWFAGGQRGGNRQDRPEF